MTADKAVANGGIAVHASAEAGKGKEQAAILTRQPSYAAALGYRMANDLTWAFTKALSFGSRSGKAESFLEGPYAPVSEEVFAQELEVLEGQVPADLEGVFARNGPNPAHAPAGGYHWFDGDGMVHAVRLRRGAAAYCNRWVATARLAQERRAGYASFLKLGDLRGATGLLKIMLHGLKTKLGVCSREGGAGTANTALAFHAGRLLALHEGDLPYQLRVACDGLLSTLGRVTFGGRVQHAFTAHPKLDPETGELFFFGYSMDQAPYCWYGRLDSDGHLVADIPVPLPTPVMMHDFAVTQKHAIFLDVPLEFDPKAMVKTGSLPFTYNASRPARFGVLPRYAKDASDLRWFSTEPMMIFHVANAWEEGDTIRLFACTFKEFSLTDFITTSDDSLPRLTEITLDLASGEATVRRLTDVPGDFPVVPPALVGRPAKYAYVAAVDPEASSSTGAAEFSGVAKIDLTAAGPATSVAGALRHGPGRTGGEAVFAPRAGGAGAEDDGYLLTYVWDKAAGRSELVVYDAAGQLGQPPVVRLALPQRVPHGFHGLWVPAAELAQQRAALADD